MHPDRRRPLRCLTHPSTAIHTSHGCRKALSTPHTLPVRFLAPQSELHRAPWTTLALQQSDQPMLHFLPTREYTEGISMESYEGELKPLPLKQLQDLLEKHAPRRPSLVMLCARHSVEAGHVFLHAGVPH